MGLAKAERKQGTPSSGLTKLLADIGLSRDTASEVQRLGTLPEKELTKALAGHVETKGGQWKNAKHQAQWAMTLTKYCAPIRDTPVDQIDTQDVFRVLIPLWTETPETASRLRGHASKPS